MEPLDKSLVDRLDIATAVDEEAAALRNLVPPEPWPPAISTARDEVVRWVSARLRSGVVNAPDVSINAWKTQSSTRPVAIMGIGERIAYRALSNLIFEDLDRPDRTAAAYKDFIHGPIDLWIRELRGKIKTFGSAPFKYIVESDIVAFYDYVDHDLLQSELEIQGADLEAISALTDLLGETAGRTFGLPQLYEPSDWLSDVYIAVLERDLSRHGLTVWRYNDDFKIGADEYDHALEIIEQLDRGARSLGLTVSAHKTLTPSFMTYFIRNTGLTISDLAEGIDPQDVEAIVAGGNDYTNDDTDSDSGGARATLARLEPTHEERINIKRLEPGDLKHIRRALAVFTADVDDAALDWVRPLFEFVPSLTPRLIQYLIALHPFHNQRVSEILSDLRDSSSMREWQAIWLLYGFRELRLMDDTNTLEWADTQRRGFGRPVAAEAALALATVGEIELDELDEATRVEPGALTPWYLVAIRELSQQGLVPDKRLNAFRNTSPLFRWLLDN